MAGDKCFALRNHAEFYVAKNECYALAYPAFKKMKETNKCCTLRCPFYKPQRKDKRAEYEIYDRDGHLKDSYFIYGRRF